MTLGTAKDLRSGTRSEFAAALLGFGLDVGQLKVEMQLPSNEEVRTAVMAGTGRGYGDLGTGGGCWHPRQAID
jgi:hypothetical protein